MSRLDENRVRRLLIGLINQVVHEREDLRGVPTHEGNEPETVAEARAFLRELQRSGPARETGKQFPLDARVRFRESTGEPGTRAAAEAALSPATDRGTAGLHEVTGLTP